VAIVFTLLNHEVIFVPLQVNATLHVMMSEVSLKEKTSDNVNNTAAACYQNKQNSQDTLLWLRYQPASDRGVLTLHTSAIYCAYCSNSDPTDFIYGSFPSLCVCGTRSGQASGLGMPQTLQAQFTRIQATDGLVAERHVALLGAADSFVEIQCFPPAIGGRSSLRTHGIVL